MIRDQAVRAEFMPVGVLTAALQELTPRERRDPDPDLAIEEWLDFAGSSTPTASSSPRRCTRRSPTSRPRRCSIRSPTRSICASRSTRCGRSACSPPSTPPGVAIADVGYFDDMLHEDPAIRRKKHDFMLAAMDAAALLGVPAVTGFVGRNQSKSMDQNLIDFEESFVPLLKEAKARGLQYRVEQCPMPGWTPGDNFHNNIAYAPGMWIALHQICERNGVGDQFRIHYDPSHAILMGQDTRSIFQYLKDAGYGFLIAGMHVKGQVIHSEGVAGWGYGGQTVQRGDWVDGEVLGEPGRSRQRVEEADGAVRARAARHGPPRSARLPAEPHGRLARPPARRARAARLRPGDDAADRRARVRRRPACRTRRCCSRSWRARWRSPVTSTGRRRRCSRCRHEVLAAQGIPVQGVGRQAYRS